MTKKQTPSRRIFYGMEEGDGMPKDMTEPIQRWEHESLKKEVEDLKSELKESEKKVEDFVKERDKDRKMSLNVIIGALASLVVGILTFLITRGF
ncbi:hypothetical protein HBP99_15180 [Listeria booriae]|uniref:hypothetical protein n=2 Tax=Listeria booriae TaxID=1552123 RepID=UPI0016245E38|nr:hypothetical protein [Listeria booriae]MBC2369970.1 hypothetical protein [Listeria booriae]